ncbi:hypothetical protein C0995_014235 [Termitomyces sp. Mi166|nr:hypothetical protein C0995_014235 [Termitomyces sp. Mi166\
MSDQPPPSKPKPGSLRDRIAAFEKSAGSAAPASAPVPRPKPGGLSWKPKSPSPPTSPSAADPSSDKRLGNMSASDAKESIKSGGTLKERMAALQNRGGFGAASPVSPKPPMEKPKWKPPPVIAPVDKDDDDGEPSRGVDPVKLIPPVRESTSDEKSANEKDEEQLTSSDQAEGEEAAAVDPEEEEKQRRAAIAARMARLGGARVGMAPVFGRPSPAKKPEPIDEPTTPTKLETSAETSHKDDATSPPSTDEPSTETTASDEQLTVTSDTAGPISAPVRKDSGSSPLVSAEAEAQATRSPPLSMPVPSAPRRAAPPRRKAPKTPEAPPAVSEQIVNISENAPAVGLDAAPALSESATMEHAGDVHEEIDEVSEVASEPEPLVSVVAQRAEDIPPVIMKDLAVKADEPDEPSGDVDASKDAIETPTNEPATEALEPFRVDHLLEHPAKPADEDVAEVDDDEQEPAEKHMSLRNDNADEETVTNVERQEHVKEEHAEAQPIAEAKEEETVSQTADEAEEDEEVARRKRIAEKLAKMGGVNPFALPPQRQASGSSEDAQTSPTLTKHSSISRSSVGSPPLPPLPPQRKQSSRASVPEPSLLVEPTESESVADSPVLLPTTEYTIEPAALKKQSIDSEDETREINQDAKTVADLTRTASDDTDSREGPKIDHEWVTDPTEEVLHDETLGDAEPETSPPPPPPRVFNPTRPISVPAVDPAARHTPAVARPISPRRSLPPPPRLVPEPPESEEDPSESGLPSESSPLAPSSPLSHQTSEDEEEPPRRLPPRHSAPSEEPTDDETPPLPVPNRRSMQSDDFIPPSQTLALSARPLRPVPLPPTVSAPVSDAEDSDFGEVLPTPPRHRPATPATPPAPPNEIPLIVPPPASDELVKKVEFSPLRQSSHPEAVIVHVPPPPVSSGESSPALLSPPIPSPPGHGTDQEVLDEEEGDPIDPSFHSPSRRTSFINGPSTAGPPAPEPVAVSEEDEQAARRRTIAERMAKLGGIKFSAAPPLPHVARSPPPVPKEEEAEHENASEQPSGASQLTEEEEEQARKERIAAKLAMMGGMRIGMMPLGAGAVRPQIEERLPAPPSRAPLARPPPLPQTHDIDEQESGLSASQYSNATSDEGVKVEVEDSEIEEVSYADAQDVEEEPEEVPPPVPARGLRRRGTTNSESEHSSTSPPPRPRPPVPTSFPTRSASIQSTSSMARQSSVDSTHGVQKASTYKPQSEYVMVEEPSDFVPEEEIPPPPPARPSHRPPPRTAPPPPPPPEPSVPISDSISSQWEMPSIPSGSIEFSTPADISLSWPEKSSASSSRSPAPPPPPKPAVDVDVQLSSDDLMTVWGRVGVQICEVATTLFEKSKKSLIGDGTYDGFIRVVLGEVPNAVMPTSNASYGYLIYAQTGNTVQKRASEIMPGDIMVLHDAKLKGHKGLQSYHQNVGIGEPLAGVISEFEPKKSKVRLFQANQHVGQQVGFLQVYTKFR